MKREAQTVPVLRSVWVCHRPAPKSSMSKILLVEDNEINRDMLSRRLERKGYEVIVAIDGAEGVVKTYSDLPDLILMDLHLPVLDGWKATQQIKADPQTQAIPIIALTADAIAGEREKALAAGCDDYDTKPVDFPRLLEKIAKLLKPASQFAIVKATEAPNLLQNPCLQRILRTRLRRELDPPLHSIIGYSDLLLDALSRQPNPAPCSDLQKIHTSGLRLLQLIHAILNPALVEIQRQEIDLVAPTLRLELLTPLSTIVGYCEMLLEEAPSELIPDLEQIYASAQGLISRVNGLDDLIQQHLRSIQTFNTNEINTADLPQDLAAEKTLARLTARETPQIAEDSRILLIDSAANCTMLSRQLEGCQVTIATTGQQALQAIAALPYDLVLLDVSLPEIGGLKVLERLKGQEKWQQIPVMLLAAPDQMESVAQGIAIGASDYLTRPFQSVLLRTKVATCLGIVEEIAQRQIAEAALKQELAAARRELEQLKQVQQATAIVQTNYFQQLQPAIEAPEQPRQKTFLPLKVLLVEDNEMNRDMLSRRLQRSGYDVLIASDGAEGVSKALSEQPDAILMDISLPVMDGWEATQQIKAHPTTRQIPVIALTAHAMAGDREKALEAGCDDYDTKPIDLPRLLGKIEGCLKRAAE